MRKGEEMGKERTRGKKVGEKYIKRRKRVKSSKEK